jgi:hypothetical protein
MRPLTTTAHHNNNNNNNSTSQQQQQQQQQQHVTTTTTTTRVTTAYHSSMVVKQCVPTAAVKNTLKKQRCRTLHCLEVLLRQGYAVQCQVENGINDLGNPTHPAS